MQNINHSHLGKNKKSFFKTYQFIGTKFLISTKTKLFLLWVLLTAEFLNYLSLVTSAGRFVGNYANSLYLKKFFFIARADIWISEYFGTKVAFYVFLGFIIVNAAAKVCIFCQIRLKIKCNYDKF